MCLPPSSSGSKTHLTTTMGINAERANKKCYNLTSSFFSFSEVMMVCGRVRSSTGRNQKSLFNVKAICLASGHNTNNPMTSVESK